MRRIDEKPLSQNLMRRQRGKLILKGRVMFVAGANQYSVPIPSAGFRWLDQQQHLTLEQVGGKSAEHPLSEEGRVINNRIENPLVIEFLHASSLWETDRPSEAAQWSEGSANRGSSA